MTAVTLCFPIALRGSSEVGLLRLGTTPTLMPLLNKPRAWFWGVWLYWVLLGAINCNANLLNLLFLNWNNDIVTAKDGNPLLSTLTIKKSTMADSTKYKCFAKIEGMDRNIESSAKKLWIRGRIGTSAATKNRLWKPHDSCLVRYLLTFANIKRFLTF